MDVSSGGRRERAWEEMCWLLRTQRDTSTEFQFTALLSEVPTRCSKCTPNVCACVCLWPFLVHMWRLLSFRGHFMVHKYWCGSQRSGVQYQNATAANTEDLTSADGWSHSFLVPERPITRQHSPLKHHLHQAWVEVSESGGPMDHPSIHPHIHRSIHSSTIHPPSIHPAAHSSVGVLASAGL